MWLYFLLFLLLFILSWIIFIPVRIVVNTDKNHYFIKQLGSFKLEIILDQRELFYIKFRLLFIGFKIYPLRPGPKKEKPTKRKKKKKKKKKFSIKTIMLLLSIVKHNILSFKVKKLLISLDTGNVITNAYLYPLIMFANGKNIQIDINNAEGNRLITIIENTPFSMIKATLKTFIKHQINK